MFVKVAHLAEAFNLPVTSHGAQEVTVQLLAAVPNRSYLEVHGFGLDRFVRAAARSRTAARSRPSAPGTASSSTGGAGEGSRLTGAGRNGREATSGMKVNRTRRLLREGKATAGSWMMLGSSTAADLMGLAGSTGW